MCVVKIQPLGETYSTLSYSMGCVYLQDQWIGAMWQKRVSEGYHQSRRGMLPPSGILWLYLNSVSQLRAEVHLPTDSEGLFCIKLQEIQVYILLPKEISSAALTAEEEFKVLKPKIFSPNDAMKSCLTKYRINAPILDYSTNESNVTI